MTLGPALFMIMIGCLIATLFVGYNVILDKKEIEKKEQEDIDWLKHEMKCHKYRIEFAISGDVANPRYTNTLDPANLSAGADWNKRHTSKELAGFALKKFYELGFFQDNQGVTYPACQVIYAKIVKESNDPN